MAEEVVSMSGRKYTIQKRLQDKGIPFGSVYLATEGNSHVVLKEVPQNWDARNEIYYLAARSSHVRLPTDTIPDRRILVFQYLNEHLLSLAQQDVPLTQLKRILRQALQDIASLHELGISHNEIKANNILVQIRKSPVGIEVEGVLITDLEDAVKLEPGGVLQGAPLGNIMWRSPEAHVEGPMGLASDMFAFGIVCIYAMTKTLIFAINNPGLAEDDRLGTIYFRQMSYFADESGKHGFLDCLGEEHPIREMLEAIEEMCQDVPKEPLTEWEVPGLDDDFKDLVVSMTKLDPRKRITAQEGLEHRWFQGV